MKTKLNKLTTKRFVIRKSLIGTNTIITFVTKKGKTVTYKELAIKIGKPKAYRAVANACAKNPLLEIIPCHRVIRSDGKMGGYMGEEGIERKKRLLESEGVKLNFNSIK